MNITQTELDFRKWCENPDFPHLEETQLHHAKAFVDRIINNEEEFPLALYNHQKEAILRTIFNGEKLGKWEVLMDIVTGGGKTVIMAGLVAYFWQVHRIQKFLIITPNTIVRERVKDDFETTSSVFAYNDFPFFFNSFSHIPERMVCKVLREKQDAASIKDANIIIANIHQLYDGRESLDLLMADNITPEFVVINDEAHNAAADQYREVLKTMRRKLHARIDLTATPYRLDKEDLDTYPPIYEYSVGQAMKDRTVKQVVVTKPDIESVRMQYEEWDDENKVVRILDAQEMQWEEIEKELKRGGAVKFVTTETARRQQLQIAHDCCLASQIKRVPRNPDGEKQWEPLMLVIAVSLKDAEKIYETLQKKPFNYKPEQLLLVHSKQEEIENKKAFLLNRSNANGLSKEDAVIWQKTRSVRIIIAVSMLREGWDVRNISVICLFRKFSYQQKGDRIYSIYGPQIIGRGLRKIRIGKKEVDHLLVADHPAFDHDWLWEYMGAEVFGSIKNEEEVEGVLDELDEKAKQESLLIEPEIDNGDNNQEEPDVESWIEGLPNAESIQPIADWKKYFQELDIKKKIKDATQNIVGLKTKAIGSGNTAHEIPEGSLNLPSEINESNKSNNLVSREDKIRGIKEDVEKLPQKSLRDFGKQESAEDLIKLIEALDWILKEKYSLKSISDIETSSDKLIDEIDFTLPNIISAFRQPEIIAGIIGN